jgi:hypothetical protein
MRSAAAADETLHLCPATASLTIFAETDQLLAAACQGRLLDKQEYHSCVNNAQNNCLWLRFSVRFKYGCYACWHKLESAQRAKVGDISIADKEDDQLLFQIIHAVEPAALAVHFAIACCTPWCCLHCQRDVSTQ